MPKTKPRGAHGNALISDFDSPKRRLVILGYLGSARYERNTSAVY